MQCGQQSARLMRAQRQQTLAALCGQVLQAPQAVFINEQGAGSETPLHPHMAQILLQLGSQRLGRVRRGEDFFRHAKATSDQGCVDSVLATLPAPF